MHIVLHTTALLSLITMSCLTKAPSAGGGAGKRARLAEVKMELPASTDFKPSSGSAVVNALKLIVRPQVESCANATKIDEVRGYADSTLSQKFMKGCAYFVTLALGEKSASGNFSAYYQNSTEQAVSESDLNVSPVKIPLNLTLTQAGQSANMPERVTTSSVPAPQPNPQSTPSPSPSPSLAPLPAPLSSAQFVGAGSKSATLDELFKTEYLVIDYSAIGCGICVQHSNQVNKDLAKQKKMNGSGKCSSITVVDKSTVADWIEIFDRDSSNPQTFTGKTSYGFSGGASSFGRLFGVTIRGTPTVQLVDRQGKVVVSDLRSNPRGIDQYCN